MEITKNKRTLVDNRINSFGQITTSFDSVEDVIVTGTLAEIIEYSYHHQVYLDRSEKTEYLFREWDEDAKYVVICDGKPILYADRKCDLNEPDWYTHKGVIYAADPTEKEHQENDK